MLPNPVIALPLKSVRLPAPVRCTWDQKAPGSRCLHPARLVMSWDRVVSRGAEGAAMSAVDSGAHKIIGLLAAALHCLRRIGAENLVHVEWRPLEHDVGGREGADIAAGSGERHPRRRQVFSLRCGQREGIVVGPGIDVLDRVRPVEERGRKVDAGRVGCRDRSGCWR